MEVGPVEERLVEERHVEERVEELGRLGEGVLEK